MTQQNGWLQAVALVDPEPGLVGELELPGKLLPAATAAWSAAVAAVAAAAAADAVVVNLAAAAAAAAAAGC